MNCYLHGDSGWRSSLQLQPPEPFDFKSPDNWPKWRRRFQQYRDATCNLQQMAGHISVLTASKKAVSGKEESTSAMGAGAVVLEKLLELK